MPTFDLCANFDKQYLLRLAHIHNLCVIYDIDKLSESAHIWYMNDLARDPKQIGNSIRRSRRARHWSQQELASRVGIRQETISLIENGNPATKIETLLAVLSALGLEFQVAPRSKLSRHEVEGET